MIVNISSLLAFTMEIEFIVCIYAAILIARIYACHRINQKREVNIIVLALYTAFVISVAFFPISFTLYVPPAFLPSNVNWQPFVQIIYKFEQLSGGILPMNQRIGNLALYLLGNFFILFPIGFIAPQVSKKLRRPILFFAVMLLVSIIIEVLQFLESSVGIVSDKGANFDDMMLKLIGAVLGYGLLIYLKKRLGVKETAKAKA